MSTEPVSTMRWPVQETRLVLIHGHTLDTRMWDDQFEPFARHYRVIRYDMRGYGKSALPTAESYAPADDLMALLRHLGLRSAHILGQSRGGAVAIDFALTYPEATATLIAVDLVLRGFQAPRLKQMVGDYSGWAWINDEPLRPLDPPSIQQIHRINIPTLVIVGERDVPDFLAIAGTLHQRILTASKVVMTGVGHMSNMEDPELFNKIVRGFLSNK